MNGAVDLLACYWTLAGNYVFGNEDHSPWDFRLRAEAAAAAGYTGIGIKQADLRRVLAKHGIAGMRAILKDNAIRHLELEALFDWCAAGERRKASDADRQLLLATAAQLGAARIKAAGDFGGADWPLEQMHDAFQVLAREAPPGGDAVLRQQYARAWSEAEGAAYLESLKKRFKVEVKEAEVAAAAAAASAATP